MNLLIGTESTTPVVRALVRDVAIEGSAPNREALREITRSRARELLSNNQIKQDEQVNQRRSTPRQFNVDDLVFVIKYSQSAGKLDSGMRGPYKVVEILPSGRYTLRLLGGSYGKTTQAAAQFMVPWRGEWSPETCAAFFESKLILLCCQLREAHSYEYYLNGEPHLHDSLCLLRCFSMDDCGHCVGKPRYV